MKYAKMGLMGLLLCCLIGAGPALADETRTGEEMITAIRAAVAEKPGQVEKAEADDGRIDVEIVTADKREFEVQVDPGTGRVVKVESEGTDSGRDVLPASALIKAIETATARQLGTFSEVDVERRGSRTVVEMELRGPSGEELDYVYDPANGSLVRD